MCSSAVFCIVMIYLFAGEDDDDYEHPGNIPNSVMPILKC